MKKILILIDSLTRAGAERVNVDLVNNLSKRFKPIVICVNGIGGKDNFKKELQVRPIIFSSGIKGPTDIVKKLPNIIKTARKINQIIKKENIEIIQSSLEISDVYGVILKILNPKIKFISVRHNMVPSRKRFVWRRINSSILKKADKVLCVSQGVVSFTRRYYKVSKNKIRMIYNSVNTNQIEKAKPLNIKEAKNKLIFLAVGRLVEQKNFLTLVDAFSKIDNKQAILIIIGEGHQKEDIKRLIKQKKLEKNVILVGPTNKIFNYYKAADVFVVPSKWEGLGIVFLEAMVAGLPVITTNIKPMTEFIENNKTGLLINNKKELIKAMDLLLKDKEKRLKIGNSAKKEISKRFSIKEMVKNYEQVYELI